MNYYKINMVIESRLSFKELVYGDAMEKILDIIDEEMRGEVGFATWEQIDEHGNPIESDYDIFSTKDVFQNIRRAK